MSDVQTRSDSNGDGQLMAELGPQLLIRLWAMIRTARTHDVTNQTFQRQLQDCLAVLHRGIEEENELVLVAVAEYFYLNGVRIKAHSSLLSLYHGLMAEFERRSLGGLRFHQEVTAAELERFFQLFMAAEDPGIAEHLHEAIQ